MFQFKTAFFSSRVTSDCWRKSFVFLIGLWGLAASASAQEDHSPNGLKGLNNLKAHAPLNFTIVIPQILRILENTHPPMLQASLHSPASQVTASQRIVVLSTMGKGFCMDMSLTQAQVTDWNLSISGNVGSRLQQTAGGYRLCLSHAGRYEMTLQHEFGVKVASSARSNTQPGLDWPVQVSVATP